MLKYSFRVFDNNDNLILSAIVPMEHLFDFLDKYENVGIVKAYVLNEEGEK